MKNLFEQGRARLSLVTSNPDFSAVTTPAQAAKLSDTGRLKRILLHPVALGGVDAEVNAAYVPPAVVSLQSRLTETLERYVSEGRIDNLSVEPEYKGKSLVPTKIRVRATHSEHEEEEFTTVIGIW
jgi:hypothetical protein